MKPLNCLLIVLKLAVLGGNDPHSYGVTSRRASMNTLRPKLGPSYLSPQQALD